MDGPLKDKSYRFAIRIVTLSQNEAHFSLLAIHFSLFTYDLFSKLYLKGKSHP